MHYLVVPSAAIRTRDRSLTRRVLYRLSYEGGKLARCVRWRHYLVKLLALSR